MSLARKLSAAVALAPQPLEDKAAIAGCGCGAGSGTTCSTCGPRRVPSPLVQNGGSYGVMPPQNIAALPTVTMANLPAEPYVDMHADLACMTFVLGEAVIAGGAVSDVVVQPSKGCFEAFYIEIWAWDDADPQSDQHVLVRRFFTSDCPTDCRVLAVTDRALQPVGGAGPRRFRATFGRTPNGENMHVEIENPNADGDVRVQVIVWGYCLPSPCAC